MNRLELGLVWVAAFGALILFAGPGCVSKGKYNDLKAQKVAIEKNRDVLSEQVVVLEAERDDLSLGLAAAVAENAVMSDTYAELVSELQIEVAAGQVEVMQMRDGIRLNVSQDLLFGSGGITLGAKGRDLIARVADQIKDEAAVISVEGNTDNVPVGPALRDRYATNWELAGARAAEVVRLLADHGVDPASMRAVSRGPFDPVASNETAEGRAKNRRTEIVLRPVTE